MLGQLPIERIDELRALDAPNAGCVGPMRRLQIVDFGVFIKPGGTCHHIVRDGAKFGEQGRLKHVFHQQVAFVSVLRDLRFVQHRFV